MLKAVEFLEDVAESAVVAAFLRAELHSPRYRSTVLSLLAQAAASAQIIDRPNLDDAPENGVRARVLAAYRGWPDRFLFHRFPRAVRWRRAVLDNSELGAVHCINDDPRLPGRESWDKVSWFDSPAVPASSRTARERYGEVDPIPAMRPCSAASSRRLRTSVPVRSIPS